MNNLTVDTKTLDLANVEAVLGEALQAAKEAALAKHIKIDQRDASGFAWVTVHDVRSNSKLGKLLATHGFSKSYTGDLMLWNPSNFASQYISVLEAGAYAYANVLKVELGIKAYAGSRMGYVVQNTVCVCSVVLV